MKETNAMIDIIYNFSTGETAQYLRNKLGIEIKSLIDIPIIQVEDISFSDSKIERRDGKVIYKMGDDEFLMFAYLKRFRTKQYKSMPKFHIHECEAKVTFSNFFFSNKMPVKIYSTDENKLYENQYLKMCKQCKKISFKSLFSFGANNNEWHNAVLDYAENLKYPIYKSDGYLTIWSQISTAYREKQQWKCNNKKCGITLNMPNQQYFLHVHHKDGNKKNNKQSNFECLCILCHAFEHEQKLRKGEGFADILAFVELHELDLKRLGNPYLLKWKEIQKEMGLYDFL